MLRVGLLKLTFKRIFSKSLQRRKILRVWVQGKEAKCHIGRVLLAKHVWMTFLIQKRQPFVE